MAPEKAIIGKVASAKVVVQFKEELARLQMECDLSTATAESTVTVVHKELGGLTAAASSLESEKGTLQKEFKTSAMTHAKAKAGLA